MAYRSMQPCANPLYKLCHVLQPPTAAPCHQVGTTDSMISSSFGMLSFQHVQAMIYLKVSVSDFLTLFSARTQHAFWEVAPNKALAIAGVFALTVSTLLVRVV